ncbi:MAG: DUF3575 domain-containing protein [Alloprevotella sp.]|nr:DUF3575 domain-containing protein [Alloprevotella sp.]
MQRKQHSLRFILAVAAMACFSGAYAQRHALKTNALYWAAGGSGNLTYEYKFADRWTANISGGLNLWCRYGSRDRNRKIRHVLVQPEVRYWFCEAFSGHYVGAHAIYSHYNAGNVHMPFGIWKDLRHNRFQGDLGAIGVLYGYNWPVSSHSSIEATVGIGVGITNYDKYGCNWCADRIGNETKTFVMPTKLALSYVYYFK